MRRLTATEYNNTVKALLGAQLVTLQEPAASGGYDTSSASFSISSPIVEQLLDLAEQAAAKVDVVKLAACASGIAEEACARAFATAFGRRALRRPLAAAEVDDYAELYRSARAAGNDHPTALRALVTRFLIAPDFLYRVERGRGPRADGSAPKLTAFELASRLSYFLWQTMPDDPLLAAAESGQLETPAQLAEQATRLLGDARAKETVWRFHQQWLELDRLDETHKDDKIYPSFEGIKPELLLALRRYVEQALFQGAGDARTLLTAPVTFADAKLAAFYEFKTTSAELVAIDTPATERAGLLAQPAWLAAFGKSDRSSPILRGVFVRDRLLCTPPDPPPPGASTIPPNTPPAKTTRDFYANLTSAASCRACHDGINPIGFALESFDAIGRYRTDENGTPIDASGAIPVGDAAGPVTGASALASKLAASADVARCLARQWFRFAYQRVETDGDAPFVDRAAGALASGRVVDAIVALTQTEAFSRVDYTTGPVQP